MLEKSEVVVFNGIAFRRYPNSPRHSDRVYYTPNSGHRKRGVGRLHQEIWKTAHGEIPHGYEIHHKDGNALNNALDNLECVPAAKHREHHAAMLPEARREWLKTHAKRIQPKAVNWHQSDEGRAWHVEHGKATWAGVEPIKKTCEHCGHEFETKAKRQDVRFCSDNCRAYSRKQGKTDHETRYCLICGDPFSVNKYSKAQCCSPSCARSYGHRKRRAND